MLDRGESENLGEFSLFDGTVWTFSRSQGWVNASAVCKIKLRKIEETRRNQKKPEK
jgi:hypothetical protein